MVDRASRVAPLDRDSRKDQWLCSTRRPRQIGYRFDFNWNNKGPVTIAVFSNGSLVSRGDDDMQQPIPLTENAQPGQKFLIAVRIDAPEVETLFHHAQLTIEPVGRPDPAMLRTEILAARPMIAAYEEGRSGTSAATRCRSQS